MHSLSRYLRRLPSDAVCTPGGDNHKEGKTQSGTTSSRPTRPTRTCAPTPPPKLSDLIELSDFIADEEWDAVRELLTDPNAKFLVRSCSYPDHHESNDDCHDSIAIHNNALHYACRFYPPFDVVKLIHLAHPEYLTQVDSAGRTVLHTAIRYGSDPRTIRYLCAKYPSAAGALDLSNQTPLHYLCRYYGKSHDPYKSRGSKTECMREIVRALFANSPKQTVNVEDEDGCTALERAIETDAPYKLIKFLQKACETDWREASDSSGMDHEALKQVLHDHAMKSQRKLSIAIERKSSRMLRRESSNSLFGMVQGGPTRRTQVSKQA